MEDIHQALVSWVNTFSLQEKVESLQSLHSGVAVVQLAQIISGKVPTELSGNEECFQYAKSVLEEFFHTSLDNILSRDELLRDEDTTEITKLLLLLLGFAVQCEQNEDFVLAITDLPESTQHSLKGLIEQVLELISDGALENGMFNISFCTDLGEADHVFGSPEPAASDSIGDPGHTPCHLSSTPTRVDSYRKSAISQQALAAEMNPSPLSSHTSHSSVRFSDDMDSSSSMFSASRSSSQKAWLMKCSSPALRRWLASPTRSKLRRIRQDSDEETVLSQKVSSLTFALREQITLREDYEHQLQEAQEQLCRSEAQVRDLSNALRDTNMQLAELDDLRQVNTQFQSKEAELDRCRRRLEDADHVREYADQLQSDISKLREDNLYLSQKLDEVQKIEGRVEHYKAQLHAIEFRCGTEKARADQLQVELDKLSSAQGQSVQHCATLESRCQQLEAQVTQLKEQLEQVSNESEMANLGLTLAQHDELVQLRNVNEHLRQQLPTKDELQQALLRAESAESLKDMYEKNFIEAKKELLEAEKSHLSLKEEASTLQEELIVLRQHVDTERKVVATVKAERDELQQKLAVREDENSQLQSSVTESAAALQTAQAVRQELEQQLVVVRCELQTVSDTACQHRLEQNDELAGVRRQLAEVSRQLDEQKAGCASQQSALERQQALFQEQRQQWQQQQMSNKEELTASIVQIEQLRATLSSERDSHCHQLQEERQGHENALLAMQSKLNMSLSHIDDLSHQLNVAKQQSKDDLLSQQEQHQAECNHLRSEHQEAVEAAAVAHKTTKTKLKGAEEQLATQQELLATKEKEKKSLVAKLDSTIDSLKAELSVQSEMNTALSKRNNELCAVEKELSSQTAILEQVQGHLEKAETECVRLQQQCLLYEEQRVELGGQHQSAKDEVLALQGQLANAHDQINNLVQQLASMKEEWTSEVCTMKEQHQNASEEEASKYNNTLDEVKNAHDRTKEELKTLQEQMAAQQEQHSIQEMQSQATITELKEALKMAQKVLLTEQEMGKTLTSCNEELSASCISLQNKIGAVECLLHSTQEQLDEVKSERDNLQAHLQKQQCANEEQQCHFEVKQKAVEDRVAALQNELTASHHRAEDIKGQLHTAKKLLNGELALLKELHTSLQEQYVSLREQHVSLQEQHAADRKDLVSAQNNLDSAQKEAEMLQHELATAKQQLENEAATLQQLHEQIAELKATAENYIIQLQSCSQETDNIAELEDKISSLTQQLEEQRRASQEQAASMAEVASLYQRLRHLEKTEEMRKADLSLVREDLNKARQRELEAMQEKTLLQEQLVSQTRSQGRELKMAKEEIQNTITAEAGKWQKLMDAELAAAHELALEEKQALQEHLQMQKAHFEKKTELLEAQLQHAEKRLFEYQLQIKCASMDVPMPQQRQNVSSRQPMFAQPGYEALQEEFDQASAKNALIALQETDDELVDRNPQDVSAKVSHVSSQPSRASTLSSRFSTQPSRRLTTTLPKERDEDERLRELQRRNTLAPAHLKSSYPLETMASEKEVDEKALKGNALRTSQQQLCVSIATTTDMDSLEVDQTENDGVAVVPVKVRQPLALEFSPPKSHAQGRQPPPRLAALQAGKRSAAGGEDPQEKRRMTYCVESGTPVRRSRPTTATRQSATRSTARTTPAAHQSTRRPKTTASTRPTRPLATKN